MFPFGSISVDHRIIDNQTMKHRSASTCPGSKTALETLMIHRLSLPFTVDNTSTRLKEEARLHSPCTFSRPLTPEVQTVKCLSERTICLCSTSARNNIDIPLAETCFRWPRASVYIAVYFDVATSTQRKCHCVTFQRCGEMKVHKDRDGVQLWVCAWL